jgi:Domain of unknown function (DUF6265)
MKKIYIIFLFVVLLGATNIINNNKVFKKFYSMEGTWKMNGKRGPVYEEWKKLNKNHLQSRSYIIKGSDTVLNERVSLTNTKEGIFYTSVVEDQNNKQPIPFKMTGYGNNKFIFENPKHDFPKRIVYHLINTDSLHAFIDDGTEAGKKQNFYFKRLNISK